MTKKEKASIGIEKMMSVDEIAYRLWRKYVSKQEQGDPEIMRELREEIETNPYPVNTQNPILSRMIKDGAGFDGYNAAMVTLSYIAALCRYYEQLIS